MRSSNTLPLVLISLLTLLVVAALGAECLDTSALQETPQVNDWVVDEATGVIFGADAATLINSNFKTSWDERCVQNAPCTSNNDCGTGIWQSICSASGRCMCF